MKTKILADFEICISILLSKDEKVARKDLLKRDDIIITNADKGIAVVTMDVNDHAREAKRQLNHSRNCKVLAIDPTTSNNELVSQTTHRFKKEQLINENIANGLKNQSPGTLQFYLQKFTKKATQVVLW